MTAIPFSAGPMLVKGDQEWADRGLCSERTRLGLRKRYPVLGTIRMSSISRSLIGRKKYVQAKRMGRDDKRRISVPEGLNAPSDAGACSSSSSALDTTSTTLSPGNGRAPMSMQRRRSSRHTMLGSRLTHSLRISSTSSSLRMTATFLSPLRHCQRYAHAPA